MQRSDKLCVAQLRGFLSEQSEEPGGVVARDWGCVVTKNE